MAGPGEKGVVMTASVQTEDTDLAAGILTPDQRLRVFVSSTFRDMQDERDALQKFVFPQLRELCESRGIAFSDIDLRWGITEAQSVRNEVLQLCLAEIDESQPFFIGLLGERYGWVPETIDQSVVARWPSMSDAQDLSLTELEKKFGRTI